MIRLADFFGGATSVMFGDSEISTFDSYEVMKEFNSIVLNMGVPGTIADEWVLYFLTDKNGLKIYNKIRFLKKAISIGGNYPLRNLMPLSEPGMKKLHLLFPDSWIMLIPPVFSTVLSLVTKTKEQWDKEMNTIREYQKNIWIPRIIDTYTPFINPLTGEALPEVLRDMVHFARNCALLIEKFLDIVI
jgi:hypothetical protein